MRLWGGFVCLDTRTDIVEFDPYQYGRSLQFSLSIDYRVYYKLWVNFSEPGNSIEFLFLSCP